MTTKFQVIDALDALAIEHGESVLKRAIEKRSRRKLETVGRPKRKRWSWSHTMKHVRQQRGLCGICKQVLMFGGNNTHLDHRNPNLVEPDFDRCSNHQALCSRCNLSKGAKSIPAQSKRFGRKYTELV